MRLLWTYRSVQSLSQPIFKPSIYRAYCLKNAPHSLPKVLKIKQLNLQTKQLMMSVDWDIREAALDAYKLLAYWPTLSPVQALELLDSDFADSKVRYLLLIEESIDWIVGNLL